MVINGAVSMNSTNIWIGSPMIQSLLGRLVPVIKIVMHLAIVYFEDEPSRQPMMKRPSCTMLG
jgi:hypothetical protein